MDEPTPSTDAPVITDVRFDHIGLALRRPTDLWPVMAGALGGRYHGRGANAGYGWTQLRSANGFVVEGLNPEYHAGTDFLDRFLHHAEIIQMTGKSYRLKDRATKSPVDNQKD